MSINKVWYDKDSGRSNEDITLDNIEGRLYLTGFLCGVSGNISGIAGDCRAVIQFLKDLTCNEVQKILKSLNLDYICISRASYVECLQKSEYSVELSGPDDIYSLHFVMDMDELMLKLERLKNAAKQTLGE